MLLFISLILYYLTCLTDPGFVPVAKFKKVGDYITIFTQNIHTDMSV